MKDYIQLLAIIGALALGLYAAYCGKWELAGAVTTGLFAILNTGGKSNDQTNLPAAPAADL